MPQDIIRGGNISVEKIARISEQMANRLKRHRMQVGDIIFPRRGDVGKCALITEREAGWLCGTGCLLVRLPENTVRRSFLYHYLNQSNIIRWIETQAVGATMPNLNTSILGNLPVAYPSLPVQQRVDELLSAYDELIANNAHRQQLLGDLARQLYQEWFVRHRFPGHEHTPILNGLPEGWDLLKMREVVEYYIGGGWGAEDADSTHSVGGYVIRGTDIPTTQVGVPNKDVYRFHKPSNIKSRLLQPFDIVFEVSGGSPEQPLGRTVMVTQELLAEFGGNVICASFCKLVRPNVSKISPYYLDRFLSAYYESRLVEIYQIQSTGISNYQFEAFLTYQTIVRPTWEVLRRFDAVVAPIYQQIDLIGQRAVALRQTRDALLPRLLSGKLTVRPAEMALAE